MNTYEAAREEARRVMQLSDEELMAEAIKAGSGPWIRPPGRIEQLRQELPGAVGKVAQVMVDNPGQFALIVAGTMVATQAAFNLVKPRTVGQALALMIVLQMGLPKLAEQAIEHGWLRFRIRNDAGELVPLVWGKADSAAAGES